MGPDPAFWSAWFNFLIILGEDMGTKDGLRKARILRSRGLGGSWVSLTDHTVPSISLSEQSTKGWTPALPARLVGSAQIFHQCKSLDIPPTERLGLCSLPLNLSRSVTFI